MKKALNYIFIGVIASLLMYIFFFQSCNHCPDCPEYDIIHDTIPGDSVPYPVKVDKPFPIYRDTGSTQWRDQPVDTNALLADYFARYFYADSITDDTSFLAIILDTISQNRIASRRFLMQNLRPTMINTIVNVKEPDPKRMLFVGVGISGNKDGIKSFGADFVYKNKEDRVFSVGFDLLFKKVNYNIEFCLPLKIGVL